MFTQKLVELVGIIFGVPASIDRDENHNANEVYIRVGSDYDVSVVHGDGVYFNVPCTLSITFSPSDNDAYGFLTVKLTDYPKIPKSSQGQVSGIVTVEQNEHITVQTSAKTRIEKDVIFSVFIDHNRVSEVIKGIKYKEVNNG